MPEWNIHDEGFKNVSQDGKVAGFQVKFQSAYYRGIALSLIEDFEVAVDGETYRQDQITFTTGNRAYTLTEMERPSGSNCDTEHLTTVASGFP